MTTVFVIASNIPALSGPSPSHPGPTGGASDGFLGRGAAGPPAARGSGVRTVTEALPSRPSAYRDGSIHVTVSGHH